jgi:hypothetical protein
VESERRQIFFGAAIGIPTFYVRKDSGNLFLRKILQRTRNVRASNRYPGYLRVQNREYCRALVQILLEDGAGLIELLRLEETMADLMARLEHPERHSTAGKLTGGILGSANAKSPLHLPAREFNEGAEKYYRETLRRRHTAEGLRFLEEDCRRADLAAAGQTDGVREALATLLEGESAARFLAKAERELEGEHISVDILRKLIGLLLVTIHQDTEEAATMLRRTQ